MKRLRLSFRRVGCGGIFAEREVKGVLRGRVTADQQAAGIRQIWPSRSYHPT